MCAGVYLGCKWVQWAPVNLYFNIGSKFLCLPPAYHWHTSVMSRHRKGMKRCHLVTRIVPSGIVQLRGARCSRVWSVVNALACT